MQSSKTKSKPKAKKKSFRKVQRGTKTDQYARTIEIVTYCQHRYSKLSYQTALAHFFRQCTFALLAMFVCLHDMLVSASAANQPSASPKRKRFTQTKHDPIFYCCPFLLIFPLFFPSLTLSGHFCVVACIFLHAFFSRQHTQSRSINFYCQIEISVCYIFIMCSAIFMTLFGVYTTQ